MAVPLLLALCLIGAGCNEPETTRPRRNVILISLDTLRADRLGSYGYWRNTSPQIDAMAAAGVRFDRAMSVSAWTLPSHMSFMTGLYPSSHGTTKASRRLPVSVPTLAETMRNAGYRTFARTTGGFLAPRYGFDRGFETYQAKLAGVKIIFDRGQEDIESIAPGENFFLFLQTFVIHCPYHAPDPFIAMYQTTGPEDFIAPNTLCLRGNEPELTGGQRQYLSDRYDASIRFADHHVGVFLHWLSKQGLLDNTVVVLVSDHGEEFWDHGAFLHSHSLLDEILHVPFIILAPDIEPKVVDEPVSVVDLMPTLLDLAGLDPGSAGIDFQGTSLMGLIDGSTPASPTLRNRALLAETESSPDLHIEGLIFDGHKLVIDRSREETRLFDLALDPGEKHDLSAQAPGRVRDMTQMLVRMKDGLPAHAPEEVEAPSEENLEELRALGYVE